MSTAGLINRYVFFVTTIYNRGPISLEEIQRRFESHFGRGEEPSTFEVEPYCVNLFEQRRYMLGKSEGYKVYKK